VSQTTVSRVLRDDPYVRAETRQRVLKVLDETGYVPNAAAQRMRTNETGTFGVVVAGVRNPFYPEIIEALSDTINDSGHLMTLWVADDGGEEAAVQALSRGLIDGVIYTTISRRSTSLVAALERKAPVVLLNRTLRIPCDKVASDNGAGAAAAARHLLELGHERIGLIAGEEHTNTSDEREAGFRRALSEAGNPLADARFVRGPFSHPAGYHGMQALLDRPEPPTAVFCVNDLVAFGAIDGARVRGVRVPDDVSVVGFDDVDIARWPAYDLTTVRQPIAEMCRRGVALLQERIDGTAPSRFRNVRLPAELVARGSTRPA
jgi:LacI family transcriptional regulator